MEAVETVPGELPAPESLNASTKEAMDFVVQTAVPGVPTAQHSTPREQSHKSFAKLLHGPLLVSPGEMQEHPPRSPQHFAFPRSSPRFGGAQGGFSHLTSSL